MKEITLRAGNWFVEFPVERVAVRGYEPEGHILLKEPGVPNTVGAAFLSIREIDRLIHELQWMRREVERDDE